MLVGRLLAALPGGRSARRCPGAGGAAAAARPSSKKPETTPMLLVAGASLPTRLVSRVTRDEGACPCRALQRPARLRCWKFQLGTKLVLEQSLRCWNLLSEPRSPRSLATSPGLQVVAYNTACVTQGSVSCLSLAGSWPRNPGPASLSFCFLPLPVELEIRILSRRARSPARSGDGVPRWAQSRQPPPPPQPPGGSIKLAPPPPPPVLPGVYLGAPGPEVQGGALLSGLEV